MPPVQHDNAISHPSPDGRVIHRFRQSWLNSYWNCPERARREAFGLVERTENDAASVGTAFHHAAEQSVNYLGNDGIILGIGDVCELFDDEWNKMCDELDIRWVKRKRLGATAYGRKISARWAEHVLPTLEPFATEVPFGPIVIHEDAERIIQITGSIDYVDQRIGLVDWKSASRAYTEWEYQRWATQPTFYDLGFRHRVAEGLTGFGGAEYHGPSGQWNYCVMPDRPDPMPQWVPVQRGPQWDGWLVEQLLDLSYQLEADLPSWPKRDQHALCSPKWCPSWGDCKGKFLTQ